MSIAAASSFHNSTWDLPVRRTGLSRLPMSGDVPQLPFQNDKHLQEQLHQFQLQQQQVLQHHQHQHHQQQQQQASPKAQSPEQAGAPPHHLRIASELRLDSLDQPQDSAILQKFSALSVRFGSAAQLPVDAGAEAKAPVSPAPEPVHVAQQPLPEQSRGEGAQYSAVAPLEASAAPLPTLIHPINASSGSSSSSGGETCRAPATESSAEASQRTPVFASLDSAEEHSPPFSPAGAPIPSDSFFFSARAASFPPYSARTSPSAGPPPAAWCCCCGAGVCAACRGATFPAPLRPSASQPAPTAYYPSAQPQPHKSPSLPPATGAAPHVAYPGHAQGQAPHYPGLRPSFSSAPSPWLISPPVEVAWQAGPRGVLSRGAPASAPASIHGGAAVAASGAGDGAAAAPGSAAAALPGHWGLPQPQSPASTPDGSAHGADPLQGLHMAVSGHTQGAPSPHGGQVAAQHTDGDWGFGLHPMESSSLSLSQDDSLDMPEVSSQMQGPHSGAGHARLAGQGAGSGDEEVDSLQHTGGSPSASHASPMPPAAGSYHCPSPQHHRQQHLGSSASPPPPSLAGLLPPSSALCTPPLPSSAASGPGGLVRRTPGLGSLSPTSPGIRRGLSSFFGGKSRSFTSLAEVTGIQSIQELAKPVRHYNRRKRISHRGGAEGCSPGGGAPEGGHGRRVGLGVSPGKEPRGLFKKAGGTRQVLGIQAGLAMAVAMGALDSQGPEEEEDGEGRAEEEGERHEEGAREAGSGSLCGMETVMEESAEGAATGDQGERRA